MAVATHHDRAAAVATAILAIVAQCSDESELHTRIVDYLREEFADIQQQVANDRTGWV